MPVIKDLVTDMESTHWTKIRRVTPWLLPEGDPPEREYVVPPESMIDITQSMACIQCGACVSSCLSMEADPDFIGPAALAKAYRFVGDPRDAETKERLHDLSQDPHGIYDCTHCFSCIDACPKGVAPMDQIMRLRRAADEEDIHDQNHGRNHMEAFTKIIEKKGTLDEALLLQESLAPGIKGKLAPKHGAIKGLLESIPTAIRGLRTGKMRSLPEADPGRPSQAAGRRPEPCQADLRPHGGAQGGAQPLHPRGRGDEASSRPAIPETGDRAVEARHDRPEDGLLAGLRQPRLHHGAARIDGPGRRSPGHRAGRARSRQLLRCRRDRRAQPGARRHPQRPHLRARPADRPADDEHLLDLPGRPVRMPAAAARLRVPLAHQRDPRRGGPLLRPGGLLQQELPLGDGRGLRARPASRNRCSGRSAA